MAQNKPTAATPFLLLQGVPGLPVGLLENPLQCSDSKSPRAFVLRH